MGLEGEATNKKASTQNTGDDAVQAGIHTAEALENASQSKDKFAFRGALDEVVAFRASHTKEEFDQYMNSVREKAKADDMLPQLSIFATKTEFDLIDKNGDEMISETERKAAKFSNPLESELIQAYKSDSWSGTENKMSLGDDMSKANETRNERAFLRDFLQPGQNGERSLYDRMKNEDGSVNLEQVTSALNVSGMLNLSKREKEVLNWFKERTDGYLLFNTTNKDHLSKMCKDVGLNMDELQKHAAQKKSPTEHAITETALPAKGNVPKVAGSPEQAGTSTGGNSETGKKEALAPRVIKVEDPQLAQRRAENQKVREEVLNQRSGDRTAPTTAPFSPEDPNAHRFFDKLNQPNPVDKAMNEVERNVLLGGDAGKQMGSTAAQKAGTELGGKSERPIEATRVSSTTKEATQSNAQADVGNALKAEASKHTESEKQIKEALTIKKHESYSQCAERLLALAGEKDPSGREIRELAHQLWVADNRRKGGTLKTGQVLNIDESIRKNPNLKKIFAA
jgi:hypothetical protein